MSHRWTWVVAILMTIGSGVVHGHRTGRWGASQAVRAAVARLDRVPTAVGDWRGRPATLNPRDVAAVGIDGYLLRRYENGRDGRSVSLLLVCGRPGPVSVHTPDVCYEGAGYRMARSGPLRLAIDAGPGRTRAEFHAVDLEQEGSAAPRRLRIFWAWSGSGAWSVPESPRAAFSRLGAIYKLYVVREATADDGAIEHDPGLDFLRQLLPELEVALDATR
jgi:EpsI family protein